jgi:predicted nucleotidyltransferase
MESQLKESRTEADLVRPRLLASAFAKRMRAQFGERVGRIRLYGSAARGDWTRDSDVDVLVTLDSVTREDEDRIVSEAFRMGVMSEGILLQPVFMDERRFSELLDRERAFAIEVEQQGIPL